MTSLKVSRIGYPDDSKADCYGLAILSDRSSIQASILPDKDEGFWQAKHSETSRRKLTEDANATELLIAQLSSLLTR